MNDRTTLATYPHRTTQAQHRRPTSSSQSVATPTSLSSKNSARGARRVWIFCVVFALADLLIPEESGLVVLVGLIPFIIVAPIRATPFAFSALVIASDITDPAGGSSEFVRVNFIYGNHFVGSMAGPFLMLLLAVRLLPLSIHQEHRYLQSLAALALLFAVYARTLAGAIEGTSATSAVGPLAIIFAGLVVASAGVPLQALLAAVSAKALQIVFVGLTGMGFHIAGITRASFDSVSLLYPVALLLAIQFLAINRRIAILLAGALLGAATLTLTRQVWIWIALSLVVMGGRWSRQVRKFSSLSRLVPLLLGSLMVLAAVIPSEKRYVYLDRLKSIPSVLAGHSEEAGLPNLRYEEIRSVWAYIGDSPARLLFGAGTGSTFPLLNSGPED